MMEAARAYVRQHFTFAGYFNVDCGPGRIRGATVFGPRAAPAVSREAFAPFEDLGVVGATFTSSRRAGGTDSTSFDKAPN